MKYYSLFLLITAFLAPHFGATQPTTQLLADAETALRQLHGFSYTVTLRAATDHFTAPEVHTGRVTFERKAPRDYAYRFLLESPTERVVYDGDRLAWRDETNDMESSIVANAFHTDCGVPWTIQTQPLLRITFPELADRLRTWRQSTTTTVTVTKEVVGSERCLRISVDEATSAGSREHHELYLSIATRLPVRYLHEREDACGSTTLQADFSEITVKKSEPQ